MAKFKVGDMVKRTGESTSYLTHGNVYKITKIRKDGSLMFKEGCHTGEYLPSRFELVEQAEPVVFSKGDLVKLVEGYDQAEEGEDSEANHYVDDNEIMFARHYRISMINEYGNIKLKMDNDDPCYYWMNPNQFELVKSAPSKKKKRKVKAPVFEKGDKVTPVDDFMNIDEGTGVSPGYAKNAKIEAGKIYTVMSVANSIQLEEDKMNFYLNPRQFKLADVYEEAQDLYDEPTTTSEEDTDMYPETTAPAVKELTVATIHYVNGKDITTYSVEQQASLILEVEERIAKLKGIKAKSKAISAEIAKFQAFLKDAVALFDSLIAE